MGIDDRPGLDAAYVASRVPIEEGLFVIGPFAARVSFASQQRRALNLIWSIDEDLRRSGDDDGLRMKDVAVVGAGLAGLTAAVAVAALGGNVWILEKQSTPMAGMRSAAHRDIHPTINFWPQELLGVTTYLPFLNWFHDSCDEVIVQIVKEWDRLSRKHAGRLKGIWSQHVVSNCVKAGDKWIVNFDNSKSDTPLSMTEFDIVLLATGFGEERFTPNSDTPSYWDASQDFVSRMREFNSNPCTNYIVSGTGDGGVIEVLRLIFKGFRAGSIDSSTNPIFSDLRLASNVKAIESVAQKITLDAALHVEFPISSAVKDEVSTQLWERYSELVSPDRMGISITSALEKNRSDIKVILLGERASPLELSASPYHKLLLAHAILRGHVEYYQVPGGARVGDASLAGKDIDLAKTLGISRKRVQFDAIAHYALDATRKKIEINKHPMPGDFDDSAFLSRHGYISPLEAMLAGGGLSGKVRRLQSLYADQDWLTLEQADAFAGRLGERRPKELAKWMKTHLEMANTYFSKFYRLKVIDVCGPNIDPHYELQYESTPPNADDQLLYPSFFVGVPVFRDPVLAVPLQPSWTGHSP